MDQVRAIVRNLYDEKDGGRGQYVAVKGDELKDFFVSCGLPVCEIRKEVLGDWAPKYDDLQELSQQYSMNCDNHLRGDDSSCSRRISFTFARYLDGVETSYPRAQRALIASWFWTCIKSSASCRVESFALCLSRAAYQTFKNDSHLRYWFCWPLSLCLYGKWHCSSGDIPICPLRPPVGLYNGRHYLRTIHCQERSSQPMGFRNLSKLSFPFRGYNRLESVRGEVKRLYDEKDRGRGLYGAVKGDEIKDFFVSCGLPVCEMKKSAWGSISTHSPVSQLLPLLPTSGGNPCLGNTDTVAQAYRLGPV
ncbi:hypothetical protein CEXT_193181 [Caerostris extrusa]|uniref:Uncharacterized protein n=1 Tax=Caerostris extrusa TaxID=172846 RepID=A0AAV4UWH7_CAEEX|nr:hypothetical protein CEXT_193181 [Caerostris extrusa]